MKNVYIVLIRIFIYILLKMLFVYFPGIITAVAILAPSVSFSSATIFSRLYFTLESKYMAFNLVDDRGVMVIVVGNGHDDTSSNPGRV